jgi:hypothetical protein
MAGFARGTRENWTVWGNEANGDYFPSWETYANHSQIVIPFAKDAKQRRA